MCSSDVVCHLFLSTIKREIVLSIALKGLSSSRIHSPRLSVSGFSRSMFAGDSGFA